jgi:hypothetical protein
MPTTSSWKAVPSSLGGRGPLSQPRPGDRLLDQRRRQPREQHLCSFCARTFEPRHPRQRVCSPACRAKLDAELKKERRGKPVSHGYRRCAPCARYFKPAKSHQRFCARACARRFDGIRACERRRKPASGPCAECGASFEGRKGGSKFCSPPCRSRAYHRRKGDPVGGPRPCPACGSTFEARGYHRYCSPACPTAAYRERLLELQRAWRRRQAESVKGNLTAAA